MTRAANVEALMESSLSRDDREAGERKPRPLSLVAWMIAAKICCMFGSAAFASTLVELSRVWHLDATRAGWISSAYLLGYALAVPLLVGLTDRVDARSVYLAGCAIGAVAFAGFALFADGAWSAFLFQAMAGVSLAGAYMPGLRVLTQRLPARTRIRAVPYYTGAFGVGTGLSFLISGWAAARYGWQAAFVGGAIGSIGAAILMTIATWAVPVERDLELAPPGRHPLDFRPVLRNRGVLAYIVAYGGHCWELFAFRAWLPTFLRFAGGHPNGAGAALAVPRWSMLIVLIGVPSSIAGAELARHWPRDRMLRSFEASSIALSVIGAMSGNLSLACAVLAMFAYNVAITADSGALTAATVAAAPAHEQGASLAVYSMVGFGGGAAGPLLVGRALDLGGGFNHPQAWYLGFPAMAAGSALAAIALSVVPPRTPAVARRPAGKAAASEL